jgi:hypothetical protein
MVSEVSLSCALNSTTGILVCLSAIIRLRPNRMKPLVPLEQKVYEKCQLFTNNQYYAYSWVSALVTQFRPQNRRQCGITLLMQHILDNFHYPVFWFKNTRFWNWLCFHHHHHQVKTRQPALLGPLDWTNLYPQRRQGHKTSLFLYNTSCIIQRGSKVIQVWNYHIFVTWRLHQTHCQFSFFVCKFVILSWNEYENRKSRQLWDTVSDQIFECPKCSPSWNLSASLWSLWRKCYEWCNGEMV